MDWFKEEKNLAIIVSILLIGIATMIQELSFEYMKTKCSDTLVPLNSADSLKTEIIKKNTKEMTIDCNVTQKQFLITKKITDYYKNIACAYYANYYSFIIVVIFYTTLLTFLVFLIGSKGWQNCPLILKSSFLTTLFIATIFHFLSTVLSTKDNFQKNIDKVKTFEQIQYDIIVLTNTKGLSQTKLDSCTNINFNRIANNIDFLATLDESNLNKEFLSLKATAANQN